MAFLQTQGKGAREDEACASEGDDPAELAWFPFVAEDGEDDDGDDGADGIAQSPETGFPRVNFRPLARWDGITEDRFNIWILRAAIQSEEKQRRRYRIELLIPRQNSDRIHRNHQRRVAQSPETYRHSYRRRSTVPITDPTSRERRAEIRAALGPDG